MESVLGFESEQVYPGLVCLWSVLVVSGAGSVGCCRRNVKPGEQVDLPFAGRADFSGQRLSGSPERKALGCWCSVGKVKESALVCAWECVWVCV